MRETKTRPDAERSRRERRKERTREQIYRAAMTLLLRRGFDNVTVDEICRAADVARATFFLHFASKDHLLAEYGRRLYRDLCDAVREYRGGASGALRIVFRMMAAAAARQSDTLRSLASELVPSVRSTSANGQFCALIASIIRRGQAAGDFRRRLNPEMAARAACAAFLAMAGGWSKDAGPSEIDARVSDAFDLVLHGIADRRGRRPPDRASGQG